MLIKCTHEKTFYVFLNCKNKTNKIFKKFEMHFAGVSTKSEQAAPMTAVIGGTAGGAVFAVLLVVLAVILIRYML